MRQRGRQWWVTISLVWLLSCFLVLYSYYAMNMIDAAAATTTAGVGEAQMAAAAATEAQRHKSNVVVMVMPSPPMVSGPSTRIDRLETIGDTWGRDLLHGGNHRVVFVVDETDTATVEKAFRAWGPLEKRAAGGAGSRRSGDRHLPAIPLSNQHNRNAQGTGNNRVIVVPDAITQGGTDGDGRLRYAMQRVTEAYDPDFLFFCNEHTFVIAENLKCFVQGLDSSEPVYLGNRFVKQDQREQGKPLLNSGAAGFILSRASLSLLVEAWRGGGGEGGQETLAAPECTANSDFERGNPGITLARCLQHVGVEAQDTTDSQGGQRFNAYGPVRLAQGNIDQWYKDVHASDPGMWRAGPDCCSSDTVSFHYVGPAEARAMHHILHHRETYLDEDGNEEALSLWPSSPQALGPYAHRPKQGDDTFNLLLNKIRVCSG